MDLFQFHTSKLMASFSPFPSLNPIQPTRSRTFIIPNPKSRKLKPERNSLSCVTRNEPFIVQSSTVSEKVKRLDFEFKSLVEPIDRVKRLLRYADLLPPFDESSRIQENQVAGCTVQVWLDVKMERNGEIRFRVDSDSEIAKGFCSCLIWVLDGAKAEEVLRVKTEDFVEMNVGLPSRGNSRVNTWHNVLISMQKRTKGLVMELERDQGMEVHSSFILVNGSFNSII